MEGELIESVPTLPPESEVPMVAKEPVGQLEEPNRSEGELDALRMHHDQCRCEQTQHPSPLGAHDRKFSLTRL